jgi:enamine deaminase RidA (YjgF/YER057c/UK114 family)
LRSENGPSDGKLSEVPRPQGDYRAASTAPHLILTAGMTPRIEGVMQYAGQVGGDVSVAEAQEAAALAAGNAVSAAAAAVGSIAEIRQVLRMTVYVSAVPGFTEHSRVADGASRRLRELLGDRGAAVRSAVGVASLPGGSCVEVELTCER